MKLSAFPMLHLVHALNLSKIILCTRGGKRKNTLLKNVTVLQDMLAPCQHLQDHGNIKTSWDTCQIHGLIPVFQDQFG